MSRALLLRLALLPCLALSSAGAPGDCFGLRIVDDVTGRGVPLVEVETVNHRLWVSDNAGWVAIDEPGLLGQRVWFGLRSHGYEMAADGLGQRGVALEAKAGGRTVVRLHRVNLAERVARLTGEGGWRDSVLLGEPVPAGVRHPLLNAQVLGQDSVQVAAYRGRRFWFWGDTLRAGYPLGHFQTAGATTALNPDPEEGIDFDYFSGAGGFSRPVAPLPEPGMVWIDGVVALGDQLVAHYSRMKALGERLEHGLMAWNDASNHFEKVQALSANETWRFPAGHAVHVRRDDGDWVYFAQPYCTVRVRADEKSVRDPAAYEAWTAVSGAAPNWTHEGPPMKPGDFRLSDPVSGRPVVLHAGSVAWNAFAKKWLMIAVQSGGETSFLGEVWLAAADEPEGPWRLCVKVASHDHYSFYNPVHHDFLDREGGRVIYFEGTFSETFSGAKRPVPGADYNQVLYLLDLSACGLPGSATPATTAVSL